MINYVHTSKEGFSHFNNSLIYASQKFEKGLLSLIYLRVSQINKCPYCIDAHFKEAVKEGIEARKLNSLCVWQESIFFDEKERAVLSLAESITLLLANYSQEIENLKKFFDEKQIVELSFAIANMNAMNRIAICFSKQQIQ